MYKRPRQPLREPIQKKINRDLVLFVGPMRGEKTHIHTHNNYTGNIMDILPSPIDLGGISQVMSTPHANVHPYKKQSNIKIQISKPTFIFGACCERVSTTFQKI